MPTPLFREPPEGYISSAEACRLLRISSRTLRRRVERGEVEGEYLPRPQGSVLYVKRPDAAATREAHGAPAGGTPPDGTGQEAAQRLAVALDTVNRLVAQQAGLVSDTRRLERENGALRAERDAAIQAAQEAAARADELRARLARRRWWRWW